MINHAVRKYTAVLTLSTLSIVLFSAASWAQRQHGPHVHGLAQLNIAIEGSDIHTEMESPAINIIGFEHNPASEEELHSAQKAMAQMEKGDQLFLFSPAAKCKLITAKVGTSMKMTLDHKAEEHHHDGKDGQHHHHDGEGGHHHHHGEDGHPHHHSDIDATYHFSCINPEKLEQLQVKFFDYFQGFEKIKVQILGKDKQVGAELTSQNNSVTF